MVDVPGQVGEHGPGEQFGHGRAPFPGQAAEKITVPAPAAWYSASLAATRENPHRQRAS
jgi:hypothetical protein